jgi:hypothetical protein
MDSFCHQNEKKHIKVKYFLIKDYYDAEENNLMNPLDVALLRESVGKRARRERKGRVKQEPVLCIVGRQDTGHVS